MKIDNPVILEGNLYRFKCPHCDLYIEVHKNEINCQIFRHAAYKKDLLYINPHASKEVCTNLAETGQIVGCAKPFKLTNKNGKFIVEICDYI